MEHDDRKHTHARALADTRRDATVKSHARSAVRGEKSMGEGEGEEEEEEEDFTGEGGAEEGGVERESERERSFCKLEGLSLQ